MQRLGLGLAALGRPGYINLGHGHDLPEDKSPKAMQAHAFTVLDQAWSLGVRYFDMARSYGQAEAFFGQWLAQRGLARDALLIASKWGYRYTANWQVDAEVHEVKSHQVDVLTQQWQQSQQALGWRPDLYQIHSATLTSGAFQTGVLDRLARIRDQGVAIVLTTSGPQQAETLAKALTLKRGETPVFSAVQATYNLLEPSVAEALQQAHQQGWRVVVKESLANGRLTDRNLALAQNNPLQEIAEHKGCSMACLAMAAVLQQPWVSHVLSGATTIDQLKDNVQAVNVALTPQDLDRLAQLQQSPELYWKQRGALAWN